MIRKKATFFILTAVLALAMLIGMPATKSSSHNTAGSHSGVAVFDTIPTPTQVGSDSNPSGGGNGG